MFADTHFILIVDAFPGHSISPAIEYYSNIHILTIKGGYTPYLQALDVLIFKSVKARYYKKLDEYYTAQLYKDV